MELKPFPPEPLYKIPGRDGVLSRALLGSIAGTVGAEQAVLAEVQDSQQHCRSWVVNLMALHATGQGTTVVGATPDQSVDQRLSKVTVQWGLGGAMESALVDYPWQGCTFAIHAASVRIMGPAPQSIGFVGQSTQFGAWIAPDGGRDSSMFPPTFTTATQPVGTGSIFFGIPPRARGYLPFIVDAITGDTAVFRFLQIWANGTVQKQDTVNMTPAVWLNQPPEGRDGWLSIHPRATIIECAQLTAAITRNVGIMFKMDFG